MFQHLYFILFKVITMDFATIFFYFVQLKHLEMREELNRKGCISVRVTSNCVQRDVIGGHCGLPLAAEHNTAISQRQKLT